MKLWLNQRFSSLKVIQTLILAVLIISCDSKRSPEEDLTENFLCYGFAICGGKTPGTKFVMIGDSWTDYLFGVPLIQTLRYNLQNTYDYKIVGATTAGQEIDSVLKSGLHINAIQEAGIDVKYVLISLGGNDLLNNPIRYLDNFESEREARLQEIEFSLRTLILSGDREKVNLYKGAPLKWFIHGYDYLNPDNPNFPTGTGCRIPLLDAGFNPEEINMYIHDNFRVLNERLQNLANQIPNLYYINLQGTLGNPPASPNHLMFDCIHPNSAGFRFITDRYVNQLRVWTGDDK